MAIRDRGSTFSSHLVRSTTHMWTGQVHPSCKMANTSCGVQQTILRILPLLLLLATSTAVAAQPTTEHSRGEAGEIVKVQDSLIDAYLRHDYAVLNRVLADDYTYIDDDGLVLT